MKSTIKILVLTAFCAFFVGCNSLDQYPTNKFTDGNFWTSESRAMQVLNSCYSGLPGSGSIFDLELLSDNMCQTRTQTGTEQIRQGGAQSSNSTFSGKWSWGTIKLCNVLLSKINEVPIPESNKARMIAEARFIRAYKYFELTNFFGDIPFYLTDIAVDEALNITRTSQAEVFTQLHKELAECYDAVPAKSALPASEYGRITKAAVAMLDMRIYLMEKTVDWAKVEGICNDIMSGKYGNYSLFTKASGRYSAYEGLFFAENEYNDEVILDYAYLPNLKTYSLQDYVPQDAKGSRVNAAAPLQGLADSYLTMNGLPARSSVATIPSYDTRTNDPSWNENEPYKNRDPRMAATIAYGGMTWKDYDDVTVTADKDHCSGNYSTTGYYVRKWFDPAHLDGFVNDNNTILMRYADVLLIYAEAMEAQNKFNETVWNKTIRPIRERAGFTAEGALNYPANNYKAIIRNERRCELALEGLRYYDIIRWNEGNLWLNGNAYGAKYANNATEYLVPSKRIFDTTRGFLFAIPYNEMQKVSTLTQNPGY